MTNLQNCPFDIEPLKVSDSSANFRLSNLNYTNQDFHSIFTRIIKLIEERFPNDFSDFVESSLAIMLLEGHSFVGDLLSFKMDQQAQEIYVDTITQIENMFRVARLVGFEPTPPVPAKAMFSASIASVLPSNLVIPTPVLLSVGVGGQQIEYELFPADSENNPDFDNDIVILQGQLSTNGVIGVEGRTINDLFAGNGSVNQIYQLTQFPVIFDSVSVEIDGVRWTKVKYFTDSQPRQEFRVEYNSDWQAFVIFGNNQAGMIPSTGSKISVTYRTGGGARGNLITGAFNSQVNVPLEGFDFFVPVRFTNYTRADFGYDGDGLDEIRLKLPKYLETQNRLVSGRDIKLFSEQFVSPFNGQVGKATAILRNHGCAGNVVDLYILAKDGANGLQEASDSLKTELQAEIEDKKMITDFICIRDGVVVSVDIDINLHVGRFYRKVKEEIENKVNIRVANFFNLINWEFNKNLKSSDLVKVLSDINEINDFDITLTTADPDNSGDIVTTKFFEIIRQDQVNISFTWE